MKSFLTSMLVLASVVGIVQAEKNVLIENDAAVRVPDNWKEIEKDGITKMFQSPSSQSVLTILKEDPKEMEITELEVYTEETIRVFKEEHEGFEPSEPKAGEINGLPSQFFRGETTTEYQGQNYEMLLLVMTIKGKTHFYEVTAIIPKL
ncbi:MAG: hypothetical protein AAF585_23830, partial [Verrucomicrobiota bacterium]